MRARQPSVPKTMVVGVGAAPVRVTSILRFGAALEQDFDDRPVGAGAAQDRDGLGRGHPTALGRRDDPEPAYGAPHDEVVVVDLDRLPGLHDGATPSCAEPGE